MTRTRPTASGQEWQNGLLLTLLAWLLIGWLYNTTGAPDTARLADLPVAKLAHLGMAESAEIWFFLRVFCLLAGAGLVSRAAGISLVEAGPVGVMLIVGFYFRPTLLEMEHGLLALPLLALLGAAYLADSQDRPYRMAACIAAAGLIQTWMLALLLYLPLRRRALAAAWGVVLFAGMAGLLFAAGGFRDPVTALRTLIPFHGAGAGVDNHSIIGFARQQAGIGSPLLQNGVIALAFAALIVGLIVAAVRVPGAQSEQARLLLGLFMVSLLLALPVCRRAWLVLLLPALWTLLAGNGISLLPRAAAVAVYLVFAGSLALAPPAYFAAAAGLWLILIVAVRQAAGPEPVVSHL